MFDHRKTRSTLISTIATTSIALGAFFVLFASTAGAQSGGSPVTNYAAYPAPLPAGCPDGTGAITGVRFDNGRGGSETDLRRLDLRNGDTLTMTWQDYSPGCRTAAGDPAIVVSMAAYNAGTGVFDPTVDQQLLPGWHSCGPGMEACALVDGHYRLSVTLPSAQVACNVQTGAIIGLPLAVVGPHGSYYNSVLRGDQRPNMLIGAANFATQPCPPPAAAVAPEQAVAPAPAQPIPTVAPAPTTTTSPPAVLGETQAATPVTTAPPATAAGVAVEAATAQNLPATGRGERPTVLVGVVLVAAGAFLLIVRRPRARAGQPQRSH